MQRISQRTVGLLGAAALVGGIAALSPAAVALPPGGAGGSTPGTSSNVPSSINCGDNLNWSVSGFPAGETVNVKVDDGLQGDQNEDVQGTGVVQQVRAGSNGRASGSFVYDCGYFGDGGGHWLRFLATGPAPQNLGYTNKSSNFTVNGGGGGGNTGAGGGNAGGGGGNSGGGGGNAGGGGGAAGGGASGGGGGSDAGGGGEVVNEEIIEEGGADGEAGGGEAGNSRSTGGGSNGEGGTGEGGQNSAGGQNNAGGNSTLAADADGDVSNAASESESSAPMIGIIAGAVIIIAGIIGVATYLFMARRRAMAAQGEQYYAEQDYTEHGDEQRR